MRYVNRLLHPLVDALAVYGAALCGMPVQEVRDER